MTNKFLYGNNFIVILIVLLGVVLRLKLPILADFPLNDGGLTAAMVDDLLNNKFSPPYFTQYNQEGIPWSYPPLSYYLVAFIHSISGISILTILRVLPALLSCLQVVAFYKILDELEEHGPINKTIGLIVMSLVPCSFHYMIMGAGVSRSLGLLAGLLTLLYVLRFVKSKNKSSLFGVVLASSTAWLAHPSMVPFIITGVMAWLAFQFPFKKNLLLLQAFIISGALFSLWVAFISSRHGFATFIQASQTGGQSLSLFVEQLLQLEITTPNSYLVSGLVLIALFFPVSTRLYSFVRLWFIAYFLVDLRGGTFTFGGPLVALLLGTFFGHLLLSINMKKATLVIFHSVELAIGCYILSWSITWLDIDVDMKPLDVGKRHAFNAVRELISPGKSYLYVYNYLIEGDSSIEWSPWLLKSHSINTHQGAEWIGAFNQRLAFNINLWNLCSKSSLTEKKQFLDNVPSKFDYIILSTPSCPAFQEVLDASKTLTQISDQGTLILYSTKSRT
jgi:hypothetical protein